MAARAGHRAAQSDARRATPVGARAAPRMSATIRTVGDTLAEATALHQSGRLAEAEAVYRGLLQRRPGMPDPLFRLGLLLVHTERLAEAVEMFSAALLAAPGFAPLWSELAATQMRLGRLDAA